MLFLQILLSLCNAITLEGFKNMGVLDIEPGYCDGMLKGVNVGEDEFLNMIDIFDFPMESLEGDDSLAAGWDASELQSLGPIPAEALMDLPPVPQGKLGGDFSDAIRKHSSLGVGNAKPKQLPNYGKQSSKDNIHHEHAPTHPQDSGKFRTQSPVSVLETSGSCSAGKRLLMKPDIIIPVRARSKRARASVFNPWFTMTPVISATPAHKKAAGYYKKPRGRQGVTDESFEEGKEDMYQASYVAEHYEALSIKKCSHCQVTRTPQWREGPMGPKTLCNACGVRYRSGRLYPEYRPLASPTFVPTLHSNSHRKVVAMRFMRKRTDVLKDGTVQEGPMTPPPMEFIPQHSQSKVLGQQKDFMYDVSESPSPEFAPKHRKVMDMKKEGPWQQNDAMQENIIMRGNNTMHNTFISSEGRDPNASMQFMGMREKAIKQETDSIPDPPMSPPPEFVPMSSYLLGVYSSI